MPLHLDVKGNGHADQRPLQHPNNRVPLSKQRRVTEWEDLGLGPMEEAEGLQVTCDVDSGWEGPHAKRVVRQGMAMRMCYIVRPAMACSARMSVRPV